jgi:hypothetical protein
MAELATVSRTDALLKVHKLGPLCRRTAWHFRAARARHSPQGDRSRLGAGRLGSVGGELRSNVRFGSKAAMTRRICDVRFTPKSGHC